MRAFQKVVGRPSSRLVILHPNMEVGHPKNRGTGRLTPQLPLLTTFLTPESGNVKCFVSAKEMGCWFSVSSFQM